MEQMQTMLPIAPAVSAMTAATAGLRVERPGQPHGQQENDSDEELHAKPP